MTFMNCFQNDISNMDLSVTLCVIIVLFSLSKPMSHLHIGLQVDGAIKEIDMQDFVQLCLEHIFYYGKYLPSSSIRDLSILELIYIYCLSQVDVLHFSFNTSHYYSFCTTLSDHMYFVCIWCSSAVIICKNPSQESFSPKLFTVSQNAHQVTLTGKVASISRVSY